MNVHAISKLPLKERILRKIKENPETGCWEWQGCPSPKGYGRLSIRGEMLSSHRVSYEVFVGPIDAGLHVLHKCDNPPCCNPEHLFLGTKADNMKDKVSKNRQAYGEAHGMTKLSEDDVRRIRALREHGGKLKPLAARFGVHYSMISRICRGENWTHIK